MNDVVNFLAMAALASFFLVVIALCVGAAFIIVKTTIKGKERK